MQKLKDVTQYLNYDKNKYDQLYKIIKEMRVNDATKRNCFETFGDLRITNNN